MTRFDSSRAILGNTNNNVELDVQMFIYVVHLCQIHLQDDAPPAERDRLFAFHPQGRERSRYICFYATLEAHVSSADDFHVRGSRDN